MWNNHCVGTVKGAEIKMARMSDYESIIFENKNKIDELRQRVDVLEQENMKLNMLIKDKLVDLEMDIRFLKNRIVR